MTETGADPGGEELGGRSPLRILLVVGRDVADALATLDSAIATHTSGAIEAEVTVQPSAPAHALLSAMTGGSNDSAAHDVVVLSLADDIDAWATSPSASGATGTTEWREAMRALCDHQKSRGARVIVCNASTVSVDDHISSYRGIPEPATVFANRLDAALIQLSVDEGISIIDVDGIVAELGAEDNVDGLLTYSPAARDAIRTDLVRVLDDYGFFHPRPLLPQRGRRVA